MKNFRKILVLALAVIMCITALSVTTFADDFNPSFNPSIEITARFAEDGEQIIASVVTSQPCGAIKATFTFAGDVALADKKFVDATEGEKSVISDAGTDVTFVLLAADLASGSTHWADFYFTLGENASGDIRFTLSNVDVCDVNETLVSDSQELENATLTLSETDLQTLGAQYRADNPALRFGTKLDRAQADNALASKERAKAVRCGYIAGFKFKVGEATLTATDFSTETGRFTTVTTGAIYKQAKYCLTDTEYYMIYTYAVTGITDDKQVDTDGNEEVDAYVKDLPIVVRPYVIYELDGQYGIDYGAQISKSYSDVQAVSDLLTNS